MTPDKFDTITLAALADRRAPARVLTEFAREFPHGLKRPTTSVEAEALCERLLPYREIFFSNFGRQCWLNLTKPQRWAYEGVWGRMRDVHDNIFCALEDLRDETVDTTWFNSPAYAAAVAEEAAAFEKAGKILQERKNAAASAFTSAVEAALEAHGVGEAYEEELDEASTAYSAALKDAEHQCSRERFYAQCDFSAKRQKAHDEVTLNAQRAYEEACKMIEEGWNRAFVTTFVETWMNM